MYKVVTLLCVFECRVTESTCFIIPQTVFTLRGSGGVGKGPLDPLAVRPRCRAAFFLVIYRTW